MPDVLPPAPPMFTNAPDVAPQPSSQGNGLAVAGLVMGILAVVLCWVTIINFVLGVLGIVFGAVGMAKAKKIGGKNRGMALAGLILGVIGIILGVVFIVVVVSAFKDYAKVSQRSVGRLAKHQVDRMAFESYGEWAQTHPDKACPATIDELGGDTMDPWGHPYKMFCGSTMPPGVHGGIGILSVGEDGKEGTDDDVKSWEPYR
jgi:hypothetical protein